MVAPKCGTQVSMFWKQKKEESSSNVQSVEVASDGDSSDGASGAKPSKVVANQDSASDDLTIKTTPYGRAQGMYRVPKGYTIIGDPCCAHGIIIDGAVKGTVRSGVVHISVSGKLDGAAYARELLVDGSASHVLKATDRVVLLKGAVVNGNIETPAIEIDPQAQIVNAQMKIG
jgi:hypothetical protein